MFNRKKLLEFTTLGAAQAAEADLLDYYETYQQTQGYDINSNGNVLPKVGNANYDQAVTSWSGVHTNGSPVQYYIESPSNFEFGENTNTVLALSHTFTEVDDFRDTKTQYPLMEGLKYNAILSDTFKYIFEDNKARAIISFPLTYSNFTNPFLRDRYRYINYMYLGVDTPNGYVLGTPVPPALGRTFSLTGDTSGLSIDANTGQITVTDATQITTAGTLYLAIVTTDMDNINFTITVTDESETALEFLDPENGSDSNTGKQPHAPRLTESSGNIKCYKRGTRSTTHLEMRGTGGLYFRGYGDPTDALPIFTDDDGDGAIHPRYKTGTTDFNGSGNQTIEFMEFTGGERPAQFYNVATFEMIGCRIMGAHNTVNSAGIHVRLCTNFKIKHTEVLNYYGDGIYVTDSHYGEIGFIEIDPPQGGFAGDSIQVTGQGNPSEACSNIWVHNINLKQDRDSGSLKGAIVIQETDSWLLEQAHLEGKYFGGGVMGNHGTVRDVYIYDGHLPDGNGNIGNEWGLGQGADQDSHDLSYYNVVVNDTSRGFIISGYNGPFQRYDMKINHCMVLNSSVAIRITEAWTGNITNIIGANNTSNNIYEVGDGANLAVGGDVGTKTTTGNTFQSTVADTEDCRLDLSGEVAIGETVTATIQDLPSGASVTYQWRLNGDDISGATSTTYAIPDSIDTTLQDRMPLGKRGVTIDCVATVTLSGGEKAHIYGRWDRFETFKELLPYALAPYKLTIAESSLGRIDGNSAHEILQPDLLTYAGKSDYFYVYENKLVFACPGDGETTASASYPRVELRHLTDNVWYSSYEHTIRFRVTQISDSEKVVVFQSHDPDDPEFKVVYTGKDDDTGYIRVLYKSVENAGDSEIYLKTNVANGDWTDLRIVREPFRLQFFIDANVDGTTPDYNTEDSAYDDFTRVGAVNHETWFWKGGAYYQKNTDINDICIVEHEIPGSTVFKEHTSPVWTDGTTPETDSFAEWFFGSDNTYYRDEVNSQPLKENNTPPTLQTGYMTIASSAQNGLLSFTEDTVTQTFWAVVRVTGDSILGGTLAYPVSINGGASLFTSGGDLQFNIRGGSGAVTIQAGVTTDWIFVALATDGSGALGFLGNATTHVTASNSDVKTLASPNKYVALGNVHYPLSGLYDGFDVAAAGIINDQALDATELDALYDAIVAKCSSRGITVT